jgi:hypothetical protein
VNLPLGPLPSRTRVAYVLAAAITAAAATDPVVEQLSNVGLFGKQSFTDHSNLDVIPALCIGAALIAVWAGILIRRMLARATYAPAWLRLSASDLDHASAARLIPAIFFLQLIALWTMETLEQVVVYGHTFGGTLWLGGPVLVSLVFHFAGCVLASLGLRWIVHASAKTLAEVVRNVLAFILRLRIARPAIADRRFETPRLRRREPFLTRLKGRAPPILST